MNALSHPAAKQRYALTDPFWVRWGLITTALLFIAMFLCLPLGIVLIEAFSKGWQAYNAALMQPDTLSALRLTMLTAAVTVPLNTVFGVAGALVLWLKNARYQVTTLILPPMPSNCFLG